MKHPLIKGALILTFAGFLTRILGFFYKLLLSRSIGAEQLGIYQLIFPIYSLCYTLYASGLQPAISKSVAPFHADQSKTQKKILLTGSTISFFISLLCSFCLFVCSDFIAIKLINEPRCTNGLRILSLVFPFCSISACINGYYYGQKQTLHPAISQLLEQIARIGFSLLFFCPILKKIAPFSYETAIYAIVVGEICSFLYNLFVVSFPNHTTRQKKNAPLSISRITKDLLAHAAPLTATHFSLNLLHSLEAVLIPNLLCIYGLSQKNALSIYGILTGMTVSILLFPSTIIHSLTVLLLPSISDAYARKKYSYIYKTTYRACTFCFLIGLSFSIIFLIFGKSIGIFLFHNILAGIYLQNLAFLCPLLYLNNILTSVLNGLGKTNIIFRNSMLSHITEILLLCLFISKAGIRGYFVAVLLSQLFASVLDFISISILKKQLR